MMETPSSIRAWAQETFGEHARSAVAVRTLSEVAELVEACYSYQNADRLNHTLREQYRKEVAKELADVYIMCVQLTDLDDVQVECGYSAYYAFSADRLAAEIARTMSNLVIAVMEGSTLYESESLLTMFRLLFGLADRITEDLQTHVDLKMAINRKRQWAISDNGSMRHV